MIEGLRHLLFPDVCVACRQLLESDESLVCASCLAEFSPFADNCAGGEAIRRVVAAHFGPDSMPGQAWCLYPYRHSGRLHDTLHALKYEGLFPVGVMLGRKLGELVAAAPDLRCRIDGLVPVPLHRLKHIERTYNQAAEIAEGMASVLGIPVLDRLLVRNRYTESQTGLTAAARRRNLDHAFLPGRGKCPATVLLVDDVVTTGATLTAAASALRSAGAASVFFASVALTENL